MSIPNQLNQHPTLSFVPIFMFHCHPNQWHRGHQRTSASVLGPCPTSHQASEDEKCSVTHTQQHLMTLNLSRALGLKHLFSSPMLYDVKLREVEVFGLLIQRLAVTMPLAVGSIFRGLGNRYWNCLNSHGTEGERR